MLRWKNRIKLTYVALLAKEQLSKVVIFQQALLLYQKVNDQQGELEWSERALREDSRFHQIAQTGLLLDGLLCLHHPLIRLVIPF